MTDDIVTRLRGAAAGFRIAVGTNDSFTFPTLHSDAADEIERLRTIGKELLNALTEMADKGMLPKITFRLRDAAQTMEEVLATDV